MTNENMNDFKGWIAQNTNYSGPVVSDVVCRFLRVNKIQALSKDEDIEMYFYKLNKLEKFTSLTPSVRSQLKKSVKLFKQYQDQS